MPEIVVTNGSAVSLSKLKPVSIEEFEKTCVDRCSSGKRLSALLVLPAPKERTFLLAAVIADDPAHSLSLISTALVEGGSYPSLTGRIPQAQAFEREIYEDHGLKPEGHPWLKPLRRHSGSNGSSHPFFPVSGESVHEVAVGPVHAGIIEPGHFRFQCHGEEIFHLEIQLGYQHRGAEKLLLSSLPARRAVIAESIAGDTVIGHGTAYCMAVESLSDTVVPKRGNAIRAIALELERVSNHVGDLGALCNDVGFLPGAAYFGRLRGEFLNVLMEMSGNRYGRGLLVPGGVRFDIDDAMGTRIIQRLQKAETDLT
ncbi:MAG TPA: NADH-quinone oxidoreductase subunit C, partial [Bdellovibrionota bacterium]|nr:NADH-quinone oxidoreductase subunit C [Bdellovibrionota bacterium]